MSVSYYLRVLLVGMLFGLAACGKKGDLYLPPAQNSLQALAVWQQPSLPPPASKIAAS